MRATVGVLRIMALSLAATVTSPFELARAEPTRRAPTPAPSATEIAQRVRDAYGSGRFRVRFTESSGWLEWSSEALVDRSAGSTIRPDEGSVHVRIEGERVTWFDEEGRAFREGDLSETTFGAALGFLLRDEPLDARFAFEPPVGEGCGASRCYLLKAVPLEPSCPFRSVAFLVDATSFRVQRVYLVSRAGNRSRIAFREPPQRASAR